MLEQDRLPYFCYIDEAQTYVKSEKALNDLFLRARKYMMGLIVATQNIENLTPKLTATIVYNAGTLACLKLAPGASTYFARELDLRFPYSESAHRLGLPQNDKLRPDVLYELNRGSAVIRTPSSDGYLAINVPYIKTAPDLDRNAALIATSKANYGMNTTAPEPEYTATPETPRDDVIPLPPIPNETPPSMQKRKQTRRRTRTRPDPIDGGEINIS